MEFFILADGENVGPHAGAPAAERRRQGVDVRVVYDDFGCITRLPAWAIALRLREAGHSAPTRSSRILPVLSSPPQ